MQNIMENTQARATRQRNEQTVTVRIVYAEPLENERAAMERVWAMLLGDLGDEVRDDFLVSVKQETPA